MTKPISFERQFDTWVEINNGSLVFQDYTTKSATIAFPTPGDCEDCIKGLNRLLSVWFDRKMDITRESPTQIIVTME